VRDVSTVWSTSIIRYQGHHDDLVELRRLRWHRASTDKLSYRQETKTSPGRGFYRGIAGRGRICGVRDDQGREVVLLAHFLVVDSVESVPRQPFIGTPQLPPFSSIGHDICSNSESYCLRRKQNVQCAVHIMPPLRSVSALFHDIDHPVACTSATLLACLVIGHYGTSVCLLSRHCLPLDVFQNW
jgi:hypothetical protein